MTLDEYAAKAMTVEADQTVIMVRNYALGPNAVRLDNGSRGLAEEAGEVLAVVKRHLEYGKPLDRDRLRDEAGDVLWRLAQVLKAGGLTFAEVMDANLRKLLGVRYAGGYSDARAADENRDRAAEAGAVKTGRHHVLSPLKLKDLWCKPRSQRTKSEVTRLRTEGAMYGGCCDLFADNQGCDCLSVALPDGPTRIPDDPEANPPVCRPAPYGMCDVCLRAENPHGTGRFKFSDGGTE